MSRKQSAINIALTLEGPQAEGGHVRLDDFLRELTALREALGSIDKEINGKLTVYYRVIDLNHRKPAKVVIRPILRQNLRGPKIGAKYSHLPQKIHHAFFKTIRTIEGAEEIDVSEPVIDAIADLLAGLGTDFVRGTIANKASKVKLDVDFKQRVEQLLKPQYRSYGSVEGELLGLNVARGRRFYIYPKVGPRSLSCVFPDELFAQAQAAIRKDVRVYGTKLFRENTGFPFKVVDVDRIEVLPPKVPGDFTPTPVPVEGLSADELVREAREEWDNP